MARDLDVYQLVKSFAARNKLSGVKYPAFAQAVQRQARTYDQEQPLYRDLVLHPDSVLIPKLFQLALEKRVSLQAVGNSVDMIYLPEAFTEVVLAEYRRIEENPDIPFPDEDSLKLSVPPEWIQAVAVESDLPAILAQEGDRSVPLYRIVFPDGLRPIVILSIAVADKLLEHAILKIRNYLRRGSNKDFLTQKMIGAFAGREGQLKDSMNVVLIRPYDAVTELRQGSGDFAYSFWAYLTSSIRKDLSGKTDPTPDDIAAKQASYVIDVYNNHYKNKAQRGQERESAFKTLALQIRKPPFAYAVEDILEFRDGQGRPLLGKYDRAELEEWLKGATTDAKEGALPELLTIGQALGPAKLIAKDRFLPYLVKALKDARPVIKAGIVRDWKAVLADFGSTLPMEDDAAFNTELERRLSLHSPLVSAALATPLAPLVYLEFRSEPSGDLDRCFGGDRVAPPSILLDLDRRRLLADVRMLLPFWYTVPIVSWFMKLFARRSKAKQRGPTQAPQARLEADAKDRAPANARALEFGQMAREAEKRMVPKGMSLEDYLGALNGRWNSLLDPVAKANLTEDINSLVRDFLRTSLRTMKPSSFTQDRIESMAATLADRPNLLRIRNHAALEEYIRLYMVKALKR